MKEREASSEPLSEADEHLAWLLFLAQAMKPKLLPKDQDKQLATSYPSFAERVDALAAPVRGQIGRNS